MRNLELALDAEATILDDPNPAECTRIFADLNVLYTKSDEPSHAKRAATCEKRTQRTCPNTNDQPTTTHPKRGKVMTNSAPIIAEKMTMFAFYRAYSQQVHGVDWKEINPKKPKLGDFENWLYKATNQTRMEIDAPEDDQLDALMTTFWEMFDPDDPFATAASTLGLIALNGGPKTYEPTKLSEEEEEPDMPIGPQIWRWRRRGHQWLVKGDQHNQDYKSTPKPGDVILITDQSGQQMQSQVVAFIGQTSMPFPSGRKRRVLSA